MTPSRYPQERALRALAGRPVAWHAGTTRHQPALCNDSLKKGYGAFGGPLKSAPSIRFTKIERMIRASTDVAPKLTEEATTTRSIRVRFRNLLSNATSEANVQFTLPKFHSERSK